MQTIRNCHNCPEPRDCITAEPTGPIGVGSSQKKRSVEPVEQTVDFPDGRTDVQIS